jgi:glycosyltransferase involved in cell wall biosynthesis
MERVLTDVALRAQCVERGLQRAKLYNWRDNVKQTINIIREVGSTARS